MTTKIDNSPLKEYASMAVAFLIDSKIKNGVEPAMATLSEVKSLTAEDLLQVMREMCHEKVLTCRKGVNEIMFEFTPPKR